MTEDDVTDAESAWHDAHSANRERFRLPAVARTPESSPSTADRIRHLLLTDPAGSWVAVEKGEQVVGLAQALVRDQLWVLSLLGVSPSCQDRGVGKALLDAALSHGSTSPFGLILCSRDPRAARRYLQAGFDLHPSMMAWGRVARSRLPPTPRVRPGAIADFGAVADLDRQLRHGAHGPDLEWLVQHGRRLILIPDRGYVVARGAKPVVLAARDEETAAELLAASLGSAGEEEILDVQWITAAQQWALRLVVECGLELHPMGPVMTRGFPGPLRTYVPSGAFG
jgi:GNAT superfamily N-acetyltransferase